MAFTNFIARSRQPGHLVVMRSRTITTKPSTQQMPIPSGMATRTAATIPISRRSCQGMPSSYPTAASARIGTPVIVGRQAALHQRVMVDQMRREAMAGRGVGLVGTGRSERVAAEEDQHQAGSPKRLANWAIIYNELAILIPSGPRSARAFTT